MFPQDDLPPISWENTSGQSFFDIQPQEYLKQDDQNKETTMYLELPNAATDIRYHII